MSRLIEGNQDPCKLLEIVEQKRKEHCLPSLSQLIQSIL